MKPLRRKLALAVMAYLDSLAEDTALEGIPIYSGYGTTLEDEDAGNPPVSEPELPFLAVDCAITASDEIEHIYSYEVVVHLKTDGTDEGATRADADAILHDALAILSLPPDVELPPSDTNKPFSEFLDYANKPEGEDEREEYRRPLHIYDMWTLTQPTLFDKAKHWHDQLTFGGYCQDIDSHEDEPEEEPEPDPEDE
jgi:hypothetical protein